MAVITFCNINLVFHQFVLCLVKDYYKTMEMFAILKKLKEQTRIEKRNYMKMKNFDSFDLL